MLVEVLKEIGMKGVMSEKLFFLAFGILPPMRSRPPAQACLYYSIPMKGRLLMNLNSWEPNNLVFLCSASAGERHWKCWVGLSRVTEPPTWPLCCSTTGLSLKGFCARGTGVFWQSFRSWKGAVSVMWVVCSKCSFKMLCGLTSQSEVICNYFSLLV